MSFECPWNTEITNSRKNFYKFSKNLCLGKVFEKKCPNSSFRKFQIYWEVFEKLKKFSKNLKKWAFSKKTWFRKVLEKISFQGFRKHFREIEFFENIERLENLSKIWNFDKFKSLSKTIEKQYFRKDFEVLETFGNFENSYTRISKT